MSEEEGGGVGVGGGGERLLVRSYRKYDFVEFYLKNIARGRVCVCVCVCVSVCG